MARERVSTRIRRDQIAQAALLLIADQGVENVSVAAIARILGLVPSAIYRHFRSKHEIMAAALRYLIATFHQNLDSAQAAALNALDQLEIFLFRHVAIIRHIRALPRVIFANEILVDEISGKMFNPYDIIRANLGRIADIVRAGQARREIRPDLDPDTISVMFFGLITPMMVLWQVSKGAFDVTRQTRKSWEILRNAIQCQSPSPGGSE